MMRHGPIYVGVAVVVCLTGLPFIGKAAVRGTCDTCHTMHNSQNNLPIVATGPCDFLLNTTCVSCHTGTNTGATDVSPFVPPYVDDNSAVPVYAPDGGVPSNTLAGGNFYWVRTAGYGDRCGHNVNPIVGADVLMGNTPPGVGATNPLALATQLECAGVYGCHGNRSAGQTIPITAMRETHHNNDPTIWKDGTTLVKSYRFLDGIQGFGDTKYEYQPTVTRHNKYFGKDRTAETDAAAGTISSLCAVCHQDFHNGANPTLLPNGSVNFTSGGVWIRHPTDYDMSNAVSSSEYTLYNGGTGANNPYSLVAPLATAQTTTVVQSAVYAGVTDDAVLMCMSCHRAHGSPYPALLRWNYRKWPDTANGGYDGCSICHSSKN